MNLQLKTLTYIILGIIMMMSQEVMAFDPFIPAIPQLRDINNDDDENALRGGRVDSGGLINGDETICSVNGSAIILNEKSPSGTFVGLLKVRWEKRITGGPWIVIYGANSLSYLPGPTLVTTEFRRGCREYEEDLWTYSNIVKKERVNGIDKVTITGTHVSCKNGDDGSAKAIVTGGTPGYTYEWSNGHTNDEIEDLESGEYYVVVRDLFGCAKTSNTFYVGEPQLGIELNTLFIVEPNCPGDSSGAISVEAFNGTPPYTYIWSNGDIGSSNYDLTSGIYSVTVEDALGCEFTANEIELTQPETFKLSSSTQDVSCYGMNNGNSVIMVEGGTAPYAYYWPDGVNSVFHDDLSAGVYDVFIFDAKNCFFTDKIEIEEPDSLTMESYVVNNKLCKATANILTYGGTVPYLYEWDDMGIQSSSYITDLCPGTYAIRTIDSKGCITLDSIEIDSDYTKDVIGIKIIVNPFNKEGNLIIHLPYEYPAEITVYSATGQIVELFENVNDSYIKEINFSLDMSKYSNGVYLVSVTSGGLFATEKIIIRN